MADLQYPHIFLPDSPDAIDYTNPTGGGGEFELPAHRERQSHADRLRQALDEAWAQSARDQIERQGVSLPTKEGAYLELESAPGFDLRIASLEDRGAGIELLNVRNTTNEAGIPVTRATIYIPHGKHTRLINKIQRYRDENTRTNKPKNQPLIESIDAIRRAVLQSFWYDPAEFLPNADQREWCEVWLIATEATRVAVERQFREVAATIGVPIQEGAIHFVERTVVLTHATLAELDGLLAASPHVAEFRRGKETAAFWTEIPNSEQAEWVQGLSERLSVAANARTSVCVLDTGVNAGHPLLAPVVNNSRCDSVDADWGVADDHGHGTSMCGTVAFADRLPAYLQADTQVELPFHVESIKLIPQPGAHHNRRLYGERTLQAFSRGALFDPDANRLFCLAVTSEDGRDCGRPSSWSGAIDNSAFGADGTGEKHCVVSAGNVAEPTEWQSYPDANLSSSIHDPGQAWNALTVGAVTFLEQIEDPEIAAAYTPLARTGQLSPWSTSSRTWEADQRWPIKPDILLEGGNLGVDQEGFVSQFDDLALLTVGHRPQEALFDANYATSAAAGLASEMCARLWDAYPQAWPETIRGLIVHSAEWTDELKTQFTSAAATATANMTTLLRVAGYGVPNFGRALQSTRNSLTMIAQEAIQPFEEAASSNRAKDMHLYRLPWPVEALADLPDDTQIRIDITLSYFVEPAPGEKGWRDKYKYRSHGLNFNIKKPTESDEDFILRMNKAAREDDGNYGGSSVPWAIGDWKGRSHGSIHRDWVQMNAVEARECNLVGVFPRSGWWKERPHLGRVESEARYSLIVSLSTPAEEIGAEVDLYTPIAQQISV